MKGNGLDQMSEIHGQGRVVSSDWAQQFQPLHAQNNICTTERKMVKVEGEGVPLDGNGHLKGGDVTGQGTIVTHHHLKSQR